MFAAFAVMDFCMVSGVKVIDRYWLVSEAENTPNSGAHEWDKQADGRTDRDQFKTLFLLVRGIISTYGYICAHAPVLYYHCKILTKFQVPLDTFLNISKVVTSVIKYSSL